MRFPNLLGNERLKSAFSSVDLTKIGSSVIFDGPSGIGKMTAARDLAAALLCRSDDKPCGKCPSCIRFKAGTSSDYDVFTKKENSKESVVDQIRAFRFRSFTRSGETGTKVFVVPELDKLGPACQNALLKVLEEPASSVFIITCESALSLLQTVRSRSTVYHLEPLPEITVREALIKDGKYKPEDIAKVLPLCGGRIGYARELLEKGENPAENAVRLFASALGDEYELYKAANAVSSLSRDDYALFCVRLCDTILEKIKQGGDERKLLAVNDYIISQTKLFPQNPSVTALSGALTAFCGELYGG